MYKIHSHTLSCAYLGRQISRYRKKVNSGREGIKEAQKDRMKTFVRACSRSIIDTLNSNVLQFCRKLFDLELTGLVFRLKPVITLNVDFLWRVFCFFNA